MISLGAKIRVLRKKRSLTQAQLGKMCGASRQSISRYENETAQPDFEVIKKIASIFDTDINYLMGYRTEEVNHSEIYLDGHEVELIECYRRSSKQVQVSIRRITKELSSVNCLSTYDDAKQMVSMIHEDE